METKKRESKADKLGIILNSSKLSQIFDNNGSNSEVMNLITPIKNKINQIKKEGAPIVPEFQQEPPKKDAPIEVRNQYGEAREAHQKLVAEYNKFRSERYRVASVKYKLYKKLSNILRIMASMEERQKENKPLGNLAESMKTIFDSIENNKGIYENKNSEGNMVKEFEYKNFWDGNRDKKALETTCARLREENNEFFGLCDDKKRIMADKIRFSPSVKYTFAFFAQETIKNLISFAFKDCVKGKKTLGLYSFRHEVLVASPFYHIYSHLPVFELLRQYVARYEKYLVETEKMKGKTTYFKKLSFKDSEKKFVKCVDEKAKVKKYYWVGLTGPKDKLNFDVVIGRLFDDVGTKTAKISSQVKGFLSIVISQFAKFMSCVFDKHINRKDILKPTKNHEKSIRLETLIELLTFQLTGSENEDVKNLINRTIDIHKQLQKLVKPKAI